MVDWKQRFDDVVSRVEAQRREQHMRWLTFMRDNADRLRNTCDLELAVMQVKGCPFPYGFEHNECQANSASYALAVT